MHRPLKPLVLHFPAALACAGVCLAAWPIDPMANIPVADSSGEQTLPKIAITPDGGCYIGWHDGGSGNYNLRLQRLSEYGAEQWVHNGILVSNNPQNSSLVDWDLISDSDGNAVLVFTDTRDGGADRDVFAYKIDPQGNFLWGLNGVALSSNNDFEPAPRIAELSDGSFIIVWARLPDPGDGAIQIQKLSAAGIPQYDPLVTITGAAGEDPAFCDVVAAENGEYIVMWLRSIATFLSPRHIRAAKYDGAGTLLWGPVDVFNATSVPIAHQPHILPDGAGGAIIGWHRSASNFFNSFVQHIAADGSEVFPHNGVEASATPSMHHIDPAFAYNPETGETFIFWNERNSSQSMWGIYGQKISSTGARMWGDGGIEYLPVNAINKSLPRAGIVGDGAVCVFFEEPTGSTVLDRVLAIRTNNAGVNVWGAPVEVSSFLSDKSRLPVATRADGVAIAVWEDNRNDFRDIFAQNLNPNGSLGVLGDLNCDGLITPGDIAAFVTALTSPGAYPGAYPDCRIDLADINGDGVVTPGDIAGFVQLLIGG